MKKFILISIPFYLIGLWYLLLPSPAVPDLRDSYRSQEEGDTIQHPDQKGFYTNLNRKEVIEDMQTKFAVKTGDTIIPSYRLNYRPEESFEFVRDQVPSYYLEEIVYPLRESLFVNGWEPQNSPVFKNVNAESIPLLYWDNKPIRSKVTLRPVYANVIARIVTWTLVFPSLFLALLSLKKTILKDE